nr:ribonuclease H-like domain-containing protein [Tanacetum cinerariifolium]
MSKSGSPTPPPPPPQTPTQQAPHTMSTIKLPILKKGEYDIWAMKMNHYLGYTDYLIWEVIQKGNGHVQVSTDTNGQIKILPPKTAEEILARERERKARTTFLMAIPKDHLTKFHKMKMLKRCGKLSNPDLASPLKMLIRSSLDLYLLLGLKVFESNVKGSTASSSSTQNVAFVSSKSTNSTNEASTAYGVSTSFGHNSQREGSSSYTNELIDCKSKGNQDIKRRDVWNTGNKAKDNRSRPRKQEEPEALVTLDGYDVDWTGHSEDEIENFALMAYSNSGSDTEKLSAKAEKEKEELKAKIEKWQNSSKGLNNVLDSQLSAKDKSGLGYGNQIHKGILSYENEVFGSVFDSRSSDIEDSHVNDRYAEGMHAVPFLMIGIYMPPRSDFGIDESMFTYGPKQSKTSESDAETSNFASCESNSSVETLKSVPIPVANKPKAVSKPKVWFDASIIEEYESDSDDKHVTIPLKELEKPSFAFVNTIKHVKTPRQTVKEQNTCSQNPKTNKRD